MQNRQCYLDCLVAIKPARNVSRVHMIDLEICHYSGPV